MPKKFEFDLVSLYDSLNGALRQSKSPDEVGHQIQSAQVNAQLAIAERLEAIYEEMVEAKEDRRK